MEKIKSVVLNAYRAVRTAPADQQIAFAISVALSSVFLAVVFSIAF
jgi:hypothetical protein